MEEMKQIFKKKALRRLQIVKGQIKGLEKMIVEEKYCIDVITQSSAIKQALSGIEDLLLENHLSTHVAMQMKAGQSKKATAEIVKVYKLSKRI
jgi:CsoR family transcriptional regulator, copper-sensing transcriptional repressor